MPGGSRMTRQWTRCLPAGLTILLLSNAQHTEPRSPHVSRKKPVPGHRQHAVDRRVLAGSQQICSSLLRARWLYHRERGVAPNFRWLLGHCCSPGPPICSPSSRAWRVRGEPLPEGDRPWRHPLGACGSRPRGGTSRRACRHAQAEPQCGPGRHCRPCREATLGRLVGKCNALGKGIAYYRATGWRGHRTCRHPGESRGPESLCKPGFRLPPD
jgi:hypothetical protein